MLTGGPAEAEVLCMRRERIQKKIERPKERTLDLPPLSPREVFYPHPIRREPGPKRSR
jgi:hypothetical protein